MADPAQENGQANPTKEQLCDQIGRAVGSLWQRRSGVRPPSVTTEYVGDVVRCTIEPGAPLAEAEAGDETAADPAALGERGYEDEAQAAVRRLTGRSVKAFIAKPAKRSSEKANTTNTFILERRQVKH